MNEELDIISYIIGKRKRDSVELSSDTLIFSDDGEGNITVMEADNNG